MMQKLKKMFGAQDMTVGRPLSNITAFAIPLLIGNLAQQLYNTVDSIVVGQYVGDAALAAVGASGPILNLLLLLFMGISTGAGILVSQYFGAKKKEELTRTVGTCLALTFLAGVFMMVTGPHGCSVSADYFPGHGGKRFLQYCFRRAARHGRFCYAPDFPGGRVLAEHCAGSFVCHRL